MASGLQIDVIYPDHQVITGTNDAIPDVFNAHPVRKFASGSPNFNFVAPSYLPADYSGGGFTIESYWTMQTANSGDVDIDVSIERDNTGFVITSDSFASAVSVDNTSVPGAIQTIFKVTHTLTDGAQIDSLVAGENFRIKFTRDSTNDTASGFACLLSAVITET